MNNQYNFNILDPLIDRISWLWTNLGDLLTESGDHIVALQATSLFVTMIVSLLVIWFMFYNRPTRPLDRAFFFREIVFFAILFRLFTAAYFRWGPQLWGALIFTCLLIAVCYVAWALFDEHTMSDEEIEDRLLEEEAEWQIQQSLAHTRGRKKLWWPLRRMLARRG